MLCMVFEGLKLMAFNVDIIRGNGLPRMPWALERFTHPTSHKPGA